MSQVHEKEGEIPTADTPEVAFEDTIHASGWWAGHALLWPLMLAVFVSEMLAVAIGGVVATAANIVTMVALLLFVVCAFSAFIGYYLEAKAATRTPDVDWTPTWWLYMLATPFLSPFIVAPIYLMQRHRHVGVPWRRLAFWQ